MIHELIIHFLSGEANPSEKKIRSNWLEQSAENKKLFADLHEIWLTSETQNITDQYELEAAIRKFRQKIQHEKKRQSLEEQEPKLKRWFDVDFIFSDEQVKIRRFTGIPERESILEAVSYFDLPNLVVGTIKGNKIITKSNNK